MSRQNFSITVIMKAFFGDYRSQAKLFVNENIKTVSDLENKITRIFNIRNFYLVSNSRLLPSCEDIRLLDNGDSVRVLPNDSKSEVLLLNHKFYVNDVEGTTLKNRQYSLDASPVKEKKCKKKKKYSRADSPRDDCEVANEEDTIDSELRKNIVGEQSNRLSQLSDQIKLNVSAKKTKKRQYEYTGDECPVKEKKCKKKKIKKNSQDEEDPRNSDDDGVRLKKKSKINTIRKNEALKFMNSTFESDNLFTSTCIENEATPSKLSSNEVKFPNKKKLFVTSSINKVIKGDKQNEDCGEELLKVSNVKNTGKSIASIIKGNACSDLNSKNSDIYLEKFPMNNEVLVDHSNSKSGKMNINEKDNKLKNQKDNSSSSSSESESDNDNLVEAKFNNNNVKKCIKKTRSRSSSSSSSDEEKDRKYHKENVSWSTLPLEKKSNHVKIERKPIELIEIDFSKFVFRTCDIGSVPVPKPNVIKVENKPVESKDLNEEVKVVNPSQVPFPAAPKEYSLMSGCEMVSESTCASLDSYGIQLPFGETEDATQIEMTKTTESKEKTVNTSIAEIYGEKNNTEHEMLGGITSNNSALDPPTSNPSNSKTVEGIKGSSSNSNSSKVMKLNSNSNRIKRKSHLKQFSGVNYYLKLLNKIDWDTSKSISEVNAGNSDSESDKPQKKRFQTIEESPEYKNEEVGDVAVVPEDTYETKNEGKTMDVDDVCPESTSSVCVSIDEESFVTKRKRKRHRKKKERVATPVPEKKWAMLPARRIQLVLGAPKVHIRFDGGDKGSTTEMTDLSTQKDHCGDQQVGSANNQDIRILQNITLDSSAEVDENSSAIMNTSECNAFQDESTIKTHELENSVMTLSSEISTHNVDESIDDKPCVILNGNSKEIPQNGTPNGAQVCRVSQNIDCIEPKETTERIAQSLASAKAQLIEVLENFQLKNLPENVGIISMDATES